MLFARKKSAARCHCGPVLTQPGTHKVSGTMIRFICKNSFEIRRSAAAVLVIVALTGCGGGLGGGSAPTGSIHVAWQPHPDPTVTGYVIYYGPSIPAATTVASDRPITSPGFDPQAPSVTYDPVTNLGLRPGDTVCFRLKAYNSDGESDFSQGTCTTV